MRSTFAGIAGDSGERSATAKSAPATAVTAGRWRSTASHAARAVGSTCGPPSRGAPAAIRTPRIAIPQRPESCSPASRGNAVAIDSRARIVVAGTRRTDRQSPFRLAASFALARYRPSGKLDRSFGSGGEVTTDIGEAASANAIAIDRKARIVVAGTAGSPGKPAAFALARYRPDGSLYPSFGRGGIVRTSFGDTIDSANAIAIDSAGGSSPPARPAAGSRSPATSRTEGSTRASERAAG
jgi:uncharacterized delta-60 repeat protein